MLQLISIYWNIHSAFWWVWPCSVPSSFEGERCYFVILEVRSFITPYSNLHFISPDAINVSNKGCYLAFLHFDWSWHWGDAYIALAGLQHRKCFATGLNYIIQRPFSPLPWPLYLRKKKMSAYFKMSFQPVLFVLQDCARHKEWRMAPDQEINSHTVNTRDGEPVVRDAWFGSCAIIWRKE